VIRKDGSVTHLPSLLRAVDDQLGAVPGDVTR
jgi:hypothetical protein